MRIVCNCQSQLIPDPYSISSPGCAKIPCVDVIMSEPRGLKPSVSFSSNQLTLGFPTFVGDITHSPSLEMLFLPLISSSSFLPQLISHRSCQRIPHNISLYPPHLLNKLLPHSQTIPHPLSSIPALSLLEITFYHLQQHKIHWH